MRSPDLLLRVGIAAPLAVSGYVHADLYGDGYRYVHLIGPAFLVQAAASFAIAILVLAGGPWTLRVAAAALSAGALVAFGLSAPSASSASANAAGSPPRMPRSVSPPSSPPRPVRRVRAARYPIGARTHATTIRAIASSPSVGPTGTLTPEYWTMFERVNG